MASLQHDLAIGKLLLPVYCIFCNFVKSKLCAFIIKCSRNPPFSYKNDEPTSKKINVYIFYIILYNKITSN